MAGTARRLLTTEKRNCRVEQLAAHRAHNPKVAGSSPAPAIKYAGVAQG